jgi:hypothetical protein
MIDLEDRQTYGWIGCPDPHFALRSGQRTLFVGWSVPLSRAVRREMKLWGTIGLRNESVSQGAEVVRDPVARMRRDPPQGHVAACSDATGICSQEAQANTTFEISGLLPERGRCHGTAAFRQQLPAQR